MLESDLANPKQGNVQKRENQTTLLWLPRTQRVSQTQVI